MKSVASLNFLMMSMQKTRLQQVVVISALVCGNFFLTQVSAQQVIQVAQVPWSKLTLPERELIQKIHVISVAAPETFGVIIDTQGVNESTSGTNGGAVLGGALANASYIDNALRGGSYSAVNQLAVGILGAVIGSSLDSKAQARHHFRYAVKLGNGNIQYFDEVSADPFRHPAGVCVSVPNIALTDQQLCYQTADSLRSTYLPSAATPTFAVTEQSQISLVSALPILAMPSTASHLAAQAGNSDVAVDTSVTINCQLGSLAPVRTSPEKCELIKGSKVQ